MLVNLLCWWLFMFLRMFSREAKRPCFRLIFMKPMLSFWHILTETTYRKTIDISKFFYLVSWTVVTFWLWYCGNCKVYSYLSRVLLNRSANRRKSNIFRTASVHCQTKAAAVVFAFTMCWSMFVRTNKDLFGKVDFICNRKSKPE